MIACIYPWPVPVKCPALLSYPNIITFFLTYFSVAAIDKVLSEASDCLRIVVIRMAFLHFYQKKLKNNKHLSLSFVYHLSYKSGTIPEIRKMLLYVLRIKVPDLILYRKL